MQYVHAWHTCVCASMSKQHINYHARNGLRPCVAPLHPLTTPLTDVLSVLSLLSAAGTLCSYPPYTAPPSPFRMFLRTTSFYFSIKISYICVFFFFFPCSFPLHFFPLTIPVSLCGYFFPPKELPGAVWNHLRTSPVSSIREHLPQKTQQWTVVVTLLI